jgi:hypothetical protein
LGLCERPFAAMAGRVAAVLDYRKLGYCANGMACFSVPTEKELKKSPVRYEWK